MSIRKIVGVLAVSALLIGLVGSGVGAAFSDQVTATENISVGTFACEIVAPSDGTIAPDKKSVSYTAGPILSSAAGNAPFKFTVKNVGTIPMALTVSGPTWAGTLDGSFSAMAATLSAGALAPSATALVSTGIQWTGLDNADLGDSGSATWTVNCNENVGPTVWFSSVYGGAQGFGPDFNIRDTIAGAGWAPGVPVYLKYRFGGGPDFDLCCGWAPSAFVPPYPPIPDGSGSFSISYPENCDSTGIPTYQNTDLPVVVTATQGVTTVVGGGTIVCSLH